MIDDDLFALIENRTDRHQAIDDLLSDIERIQRDHPAKNGTIVLYHEGNGIDDLSNLGDGPQFITSLRDHWLIRDMRAGPNAGSHTGRYGIDTTELRSKLYDILRNERMDRLPDGQYRQIDLHIFSNTWLRTQAVATGNMLDFENAGICYEIEDQSTKVWPSNVTLAVEVRPPAGYPIPQTRALHGLMTLLAGSSSVDGPVQMRGIEQKGPACEMSEDLNKFIDLDYAANSAFECGSPTRVAVGDLQHRCEINDYPAIGDQLDETPVRLVARIDDAPISTYDYTNIGTTHVTQITTGVGGPVLGAGSSVNVPPMGGQNVDAVLTLLPTTGCRPSGVLQTRLTSEGESIQIAASRPACIPTSIDIGEVTTQ